MATLDINNDKLITLENLKQFKGKIYNYVDDNRVVNVNFSLEVDDDGNLVAVYPDGTEAPGLSIDEDGYLVYNSEV